MTTVQHVGGLVPLVDNPRSEALIELIAAAGWDLVVFERTGLGADALARLSAVAQRVGLRVLVVEDGEPVLEDGNPVHCVDVGAAVHDALVALAGPRPSPAYSPAVPAVLLSGMLGDETLWDDVAAALPDVDLRCARIDLDDTVQEMARSVLADSPGRFALAGHSLGAIVALEVARQAPERVTRLALVNASGRAASPAQQAIWGDLAGRVTNGEFASVADEQALAGLPENKRDALGTRSRAMADTVRAEGLLRQLAAQQVRPDGLVTAAALGVPVLVVGGALDDVCPPDRQRELAEAFADADLVVLEGAGHLVPLEAPAELAQHLRRWLAR